MNTKLVISSLLAVVTVGMATNVLAQPAYIGPAKATGSCGDCHVGGTRSKTFVPGLLNLFKGIIPASAVTVQDKIKAIHSLTDAQRLPAWKAWDKKINPKATSADTAPVLSVPKTKLTVKAGGKLVIPFMVKDAEKDTYTLQVDYDFVLSKISAFNDMKMSKFSYTWKNVDAEYVGGTYPIEVFVKEDQRKKGRILESNKVVVNITVLPK
jgi:hypothetical protein